MRPVLGGPVRRTFRALATAIVPEARDLAEAGWAELEATVEAALAERPSTIRRQLVVFVRLLDLLPVLRWGRTFRGLDDGRRARFLAAVERSRLFVLRRGFWGVRTLVFMGYYTGAAAYDSIGYGARLRGWLEHPDASPRVRGLVAAGASVPPSVDYRAR